jgi:hypothetical protein
MHELFIHERYDIPRDFIYEESRLGFFTENSTNCKIIIEILWDFLKNSKTKQDLYEKKLFNYFFTRTYDEDSENLRKIIYNIEQEFKLILTILIIREGMYIEEKYIEVVHFLYNCPDDIELKKCLFYLKLLGDENA